MEYNDSFPSRLKYAMKYRKKKSVDLCNETGLSSALISQYLSGKFEPKNDKAYQIAKVLNVSPAWLLGWTDNMNDFSYVGGLLDDGKGDDFVTPVSIDNIVFNDYFPLHYSTNCPAGSFEELIEAEPDAVVYVPIKFQGKKKRLLAFQVNGTSMNNVIEDHSIVVVENTATDKINFKDGTIIVAYCDGMVTVKRLYKQQDGNITLAPDSSDKSHLPIVINPEEHPITIIGKVLWHMNPDDIADKKY